MKPAGAFLLLTAVTATLAATPLAAKERRRPAGPGTANPSALIAEEIAFARAAREKGQWTAFSKFADDEAVMFVPQPVMAQDWLRNRKDPAEAVQWEAYQVWMSCDGTLGVTRGAWTGPNDTHGYFTTIWKQRKKGDYRWVLDQGDTTAEPLEKPDWLTATVADCPARGTPRPPVPEAHEKLTRAGMDGSGKSDDGTLTWTYHVTPDNARTLSVSLSKDGAMKPVLALSVAAPKQP